MRQAIDATQQRATQVSQANNILASSYDMMPNEEADMGQDRNTPLANVKT